MPTNTEAFGALLVTRLLSDLPLPWSLPSARAYLPHFAGIYSIFSKRLMFLSSALLQTGCTLRVCSEPLAYEGMLTFAWKTLPISGMLELSGVLVFAVNIVLTFLLGRSAFAPHPRVK